MSSLEFTGTPQERQRQGEMVLTQIYRDLYGNGSPGILERIEAAMTKTATEDSIRKEQHAENQEKLTGSRTRLNWIMTGIGLVLTGIGLLFAFLWHR